jgi:hypothetical protein
MCPVHEHEYSKPQQECLPVTLAAELERPWVTFWTKAWTFPSNNNPDTPSVTSLTKPRGLPRKSTDPKMLAACHFSSYETNFVIINDSTRKSILWTYFLKKCVWTNNGILTCLRQHQQSKLRRSYRSLFLPSQNIWHIDPLQYGRKSHVPNRFTSKISYNCYKDLWILYLVQDVYGLSQYVWLKTHPFNHLS